MFSIYTYNNLDNLPIHILVEIASNLHWTDLIALESVNWGLRWTMLGNCNKNGERKCHKSEGVWPRVGKVLILHSLDAPMNLLSMEKRWQFAPNSPFFYGNENTTSGYGISNTQLHEILERCGKENVLTLDLALQRTLYEHRPRLPNRLDGAICNELIGCTRLATLDLSGIPLSGSLLVTIARACGATLRTVRLINCFRRFFRDENGETNWGRYAGPDSIPSKEQFTEFLRSTPLLEQLNIAQNDLNAFGRVLSFGSISSGLHTFIADQLRPKQLNEIAKKCGPSLRCLLIHLNEYYSAEQVETIFVKFTGLEQLWLSNFNKIVQPQQHPFPAKIGSQTLKKLTIGHNIGLNEIMVDSFLAMTNTFPKLEWLELRGDELENSTTQFDGDGHINKWHRRLTPEYMPKLSQLRLHYIKSIDDDALRKIAGVTICCCPKTTWKGLAAFLKNCPNLYLLGQAEQMTDELLELTMNTMDQRNVDKKTKHPLFYFIRFPFFSTGHYDMKEWGNKESVQSDSHNLHPAIVWREELADPPIDSHEEIFNRCM